MESELQHITKQWQRCNEVEICGFGFGFCITGTPSESPCVGPGNCCLGFLCCTLVQFCSEAQALQLLGHRISWVSDLVIECAVILHVYSYTYSAEKACDTTLDDEKKSQHNKVL